VALPGAVGVLGESEEGLGDGGEFGRADGFLGVGNLDLYIINKEPLSIKHPLMQTRTNILIPILTILERATLNKPLTPHLVILTNPDPLQRISALFDHSFVDQSAVLAPLVHIHAAFEGDDFGTD